MRDSAWGIAGFLHGPPWMFSTYIIDAMCMGPFAIYGRLRGPLGVITGLIYMTPLGPLGHVCQIWLLKAHVSLEASCARAYSTCASDHQANAYEPCIHRHRSLLETAQGGHRGSHCRCRCAPSRQRGRRVRQRLQVRVSVSPFERAYLIFSPSR